VHRAKIDNDRDNDRHEDEERRVHYRVSLAIAA